MTDDIFDRVNAHQVANSPQTDEIVLPKVNWPSYVTINDSFEEPFERGHTVDVDLATNGYVLTKEQARVVVEALKDIVSTMDSLKHYGEDIADLHVYEADIEHLADNVPRFTNALAIFFGDGKK